MSILFLLLVPACSIKNISLISEDLGKMGISKAAEKEFKVSETSPEIKQETKRVKKTSRRKNKFSFRKENKGKLPFRIGETLRFSATFWGLEGGTLYLNVLPTKHIRGREALHIRARIISSPLLGLFYRMDNTMETLMDREGLFSHRFHLKQDESKKKVDQIEFFDQEKHLIHYWKKQVHREKGFKLRQFTKKTKDYVQDTLSVMYYVRTLDLKVGEKHKFPVVSNGKTWDISVNVLRKEEIETTVGTFPAIALDMEAYFEGKLEKKKETLLWLSDDTNRYILQMEIKIKIGRLTAYLEEILHGTRSI